MKAADASKKLYQRLRIYDDVVGIGVCSANDGQCIVVYLAKRSKEILKKIPDIYFGNCVKTEVTGNFYFQQ
ncbi:hypothetical protein LK994_12080 [Ferruginibacter lapsinanis]|uniref:hypothetical protein n=1 Tax=Ferruginibacter lapsinanis TaxID=563172 RepID=UPI001E4E2026|nr:hypothetical protein [Ferruginibacter lapsinanis]UEG49370.1 hypothetical protein LK994_12080 [Ferruginibacter lapsinanis]